MLRQQRKFSVAAVQKMWKSGRENVSLPDGWGKASLMIKKGTSFSLFFAKELDMKALNVFVGGAIHF